jgi:Gamma-glutamyl cyclotransferase, AIG2-like
MARRLRAGARHLGRGSAPGALYDFGDHPGAVFALVSRYRVKGDVFKLASNPRVLTDLDRYEGVSEDEDPDEAFHRVVIEVKLDNGETLEAWAYSLKETPRARLIGGGDFIADRRIRNPQPVRP